MRIPSAQETDGIRARATTADERDFIRNRDIAATMPRAVEGCGCFMVEALVLQGEGYSDDAGLTGLRGDLDAPVVALDDLS